MARLTKRVKKLEGTGTDDQVIIWAYYNGCSEEHCREVLAAKACERGYSPPFFYDLHNHLLNGKEGPISTMFIGTRRELDDLIDEIQKMGLTIHNDPARHNRSELG